VGVSSTSGVGGTGAAAVWRRGLQKTEKIEEADILRDDRLYLCFSKLVSVVVEVAVGGENSRQVGAVRGVRETRLPRRTSGGVVALSADGRLSPFS
jgi:hypothetical protein